MFAWEAYEHGTEIHPNVDPTKLELMYKEFQDKKKDFKKEQQSGVLEKVSHYTCHRTSCKPHSMFVL